MSRLFSIRSFVSVPQSVREWSSFFSRFDPRNPAQTSINGLYSGAGSPEGVVVAPVGSLYGRTDGGAGTTLYVKESNGTGSTGWVAK
jgi:hypothetical protein